MILDTENIAGLWQAEKTRAVQLAAEIERIRVALHGYTDSDLASLAESIMRSNAALQADNERWRNAIESPLPVPPALEARQIPSVKTITAVEVQPKRAAALRKISGVEVIEFDFLRTAPTCTFDTILMNPPFAVEGAAAGVPVRTGCGAGRVGAHQVQP